MRNNLLSVEMAQVVKELARAVAEANAAKARRDAIVVRYRKLEAAALAELDHGTQLPLIDLMPRSKALH